MKFDMQGMLQQAQQMQVEMEKVKQEIAQKTIVAESGGGMIKVTMSGANQVLEIKIAKEMVNPDDIEMLEDLIVAAVNKAVKDAADMAAQEMTKVTGMLPNIPGLNLNL